MTFLKITKAEAVSRLETIALVDHLDPERAHDRADAVLLAYAPKEVRDAYQLVVDSCKWWASA